MKIYRPLIISFLCTAYCRWVQLQIIEIRTVYMQAGRMPPKQEPVQGQPDTQTIILYRTVFCSGTWRRQLRAYTLTFSYVEKSYGPRRSQKTQCERRPPTSVPRRRVFNLPDSLKLSVAVTFKVVYKLFIISICHRPIATAVWRDLSVLLDFEGKTDAFWRQFLICHLDIRFFLKWVCWWFFSKMFQGQEVCN